MFAAPNISNWKHLLLFLVALLFVFLVPEPYTSIVLVLFGAYIIFLLVSN